jgi:hypothetical protein
MTNALYLKTKERFLGWQTSGDPIDMVNDNIKAALIDTALYTFNSSDEFWSSAISAQVGTSISLASKTITNGVFDAVDAVFTSVTGASIEAIILYKDSGLPGTSLLIAYIDVVASGLPVTPNGGNITVQWAASGIFTL